MWFRIILWTVFGLVCLGPLSAYGQELVPPELEKFVEAEYPESVVPPVDSRVVMRLTIDPSGAVQSAEVVESGGESFDQAALAAAKEFRFAPATKDGKPITSRILYTYEFAAPDPSEPAEPPRGTVSGRVLSAGEQGLPVAGAKIEVSGPDGQVAQARTDDDGQFEFSLEPGRYRIEIRAAGLGRERVEVTVEADRMTEPVVRLTREADEEESIEVRVRGKSDAQKLRESAQAVNILETEDDQTRTADLAEVVARSEGIGVRRAGGLGSQSRLSINGLSADKVRFFLDGVPLEFAGYPFGIANVPVTFVERVEIYRGVVPVRFGADALGGAVNLITEDDLVGTHAAASYQAGSFGVERLTLSGRHYDEETGYFARGAGFYDHAENDYQVDVEVFDQRGRPSDATVYRFHDAYQAAGANLELGLLERDWADRLLIRGFVTHFEKEIQNNATQAIPYGEAEFGDLSAGGTLRYDHQFTAELSVDLVTGYTHTRTQVRDEASCVYDWFGQCTRDRNEPGEVAALPPNAVLWLNSVFARVTSDWGFNEDHTLRASISPTYNVRDGESRVQIDPGRRDPLAITQKLFSLVSGLEHEIRLFDQRLESITFAKHYLQTAEISEILQGTGLTDRSRDNQRFGFGEALRFRVTDWLFTKASYEWATRLPRVEEVLGNGALVVPNFELEPETSHNVNLGVELVELESIAGLWNGQLNGFWRDTDNNIRLLGNEFLSYQNVFAARSTGVEVSGKWQSPGQYLMLGANMTYQDYRNTSTEGPFAPFDGDRIPNEPYFFANGSAQLRFRRVAVEQDELKLRWNTRYVNEYFRSWESVGREETKQTIPSQLLQAVALTYSVEGDPLALDFTSEIRNLTDEKAFDFFGVQRPGRGYYFKMSARF